MNRLQQVHDVLNSNSPMSRADLQDFIPKPEPSENVRMARALNLFLNEYDGEISPEVEGELYGIRNQIEKDAIEDISDRCDIEKTEGGYPGLSHSEVVDPVSKISQLISTQMKNHMNNEKSVDVSHLARSVVEP